MVAWKLSLVATFGSLAIRFASRWLRVKVVAKIQLRGVPQYNGPARAALEAITATKTVASLNIVRENVLLGVQDEACFVEDQLIQICKDASLHKFILSLPDGYNMQCGGKGLYFSGAQRQHLAIARAVARKASLLLLDGVTSALDTESERVILDALKEATTGRTTITIVHRLSTIKNADKIFVFNEGTVKEAGTHEELLRAQGMSGYVQSAEPGHGLPWRTRM